MCPVPVNPRRVFGVDFSGAKQAGRRIWVCRAHPGAAGIRVEGVDRLAALPGGASDRGEAFRALVRKVAEAPRSAWGFDFPFALPLSVARELMGRGGPDRGGPGVGAWNAQLEMVARFRDSDALREACRRVAEHRELRRATDQDAATPFSPYNLRLVKQTYYGMTSVLRPLRDQDGVAVLPLDPLGTVPEDDLPFNVNKPAGPLPHTYVLEVCPASLLKRLGLASTGYKGPEGDAARRRTTILRWLIAQQLVRPMPRRLRERVVADAKGDALDAVLAAISAWRGYRDYDHAKLLCDPRYALEGFVYT